MRFSFISARMITHDFQSAPSLLAMPTAVIARGNLSVCPSVRPSVRPKHCRKFQSPEQGAQTLRDDNSEREREFTFTKHSKVWIVHRLIYSMLNAVPPIHDESDHVATDKDSSIRHLGGKYRRSILATIYNQSQLAERKHVVARYWSIVAVPLSVHPLSVSYYNEISCGHIWRGLVRRRGSAGPVLPVLQPFAAEMRGPCFLWDSDTDSGTRKLGSQTPTLGPKSDSNQDLLCDIMIAYLSRHRGEALVNHCVTPLWLRRIQASQKLLPVVLLQTRPVIMPLC